MLAIRKASIFFLLSSDLEFFFFVVRHKITRGWNLCRTRKRRKQKKKSTSSEKNFIQFEDECKSFSFYTITRLDLRALCSTFTRRCNKSESADSLAPAVIVLLHVFPRSLLIKTTTLKCSQLLKAASLTDCSEKLRQLNTERVDDDSWTGANNCKRLFFFWNEILPGDNTMLSISGVHRKLYQFSLHTRITNHFMYQDEREINSSPSNIILG